MNHIDWKFTKLLVNWKEGNMFTEKGILIHIPFSRPSTWSEASLATFCLVNKHIPADILVVLNPESWPKFFDQGSKKLDQKQSLLRWVSCVDYTVLEEQTKSYLPTYKNYNRYICLSLHSVRLALLAAHIRPQESFLACTAHMFCSSNRCQVQSEQRCWKPWETARFFRSIDGNLEIVVRFSRKYMLADCC